jgi:hypothetical protein
MRTKNIMMICLVIALFLIMSAGTVTAVVTDMKGDYDADGDVDFDDFVEFAAAYNKVKGEQGYDEIFDFDGDLDVDFDDFVEFAGVYGTISSEPEVITLSGDGQEATSKFTLEEGLSIFRMTHNGNSNFIIWLLDDEGNYLELLVNEIGGFDGAKAVGIQDGGSYLLGISADGDWTIDIEQPRPSTASSIPLTLRGEGQQVPELFYIDAGLTRFEMSHDGNSNFAIWLLDDEGNYVSLLVNEIGEFDGSKAVGISKNGIYLLDISADGNWEVSIENDP